MRDLDDLPPLLSQRIRLESMTADDLDALVRVTDVPAVTEKIDILGPSFTRAMGEHVIRGGFAGVDRFLGIRSRKTGALMGCVPVTQHGPDEIEIGYWLGVDFRGRGYVGEAVSALVACLRDRFPEKSIVAECRPGNTPSWRLLEKIGFRATEDAGLRPGRRKFVFDRC